MKHRSIALLAILAFVLIWTPDDAYALSCAEVSGPQEALERNGAAVFGEVRRMKADIEQAGFTGTKEYVKNVLLEVERSWNIEVDSQLIAAADYTWGYNYLEGHSYLIFLTKQQDRLVISPCSPTMEMASVDQAVQLLGEGSPPLRQVNLGYRMWFMFDKDLDLLISAAVVLIAAGCAWGWVKRLKRR